MHSLTSYSAYFHCYSFSVLWLAWTYRYIVMLITQCWRDILLQPSYVFQKRVLTPPAFIKQDRYRDDLKSQVVFLVRRVIFWICNIVTCAWNRPGITVFVGIVPGFASPSIIMPARPAWIVFFKLTWTICHYFPIFNFCLFYTVL